MKLDKNIIRQAVVKNRGGFANATDAEIARLWDSFTDDVKEVYLQSVSGAAVTRPTKKKEADCADSM